MKPDAFASTKTHTASFGGRGSLVEQMIRDEVIRLIKTPWVSTVKLTRKKEHSLLLCVVYGQINTVNIKAANYDMFKSCSQSTRQYLYKRKIFLEEQTESLKK